MSKVTPQKKTIALIAHDHKKEDLVVWCFKHLDILTKHFLIGTGTTARVISSRTGLNVIPLLSGPLGGDQQIGAKLAEGEINAVIFLADPLTAQPHDPDVKALMRIAQVYDVPMAINLATADIIITSKFMDQEYTPRIATFSK